eukprot:4949032-Pyramimonas_sp.AAC.1
MTTVIDIGSYGGVQKTKTFFYKNPKPTKKPLYENKCHVAPERKSPAALISAFGHAQGAYGSRWRSLRPHDNTGEAPNDIVHSNSDPRPKCVILS